ncbi:hypothetical protein GH714_024699 [Hevea brasiliensis]|uniref:STAS domain-containing protein n=1 Tax=Hevea brasiliensis TaxID=3981 RepID=A0A6A6KTV3_HEVBR|nr:hypothetical protein GH714_024699 [Hevea brasiliensis]
MGSKTRETYTVEELQQLDADDTGRRERAQWVLNSPDPPGLLHDIISSVKDVAFPLGHTTATQTTSRRAVSFLKGLFPILSWGRDYRFSKFKKRPNGGLALASLSIPQSIGYATLAKLDPQYGLSVVSMLLSSMIQEIEDPATDPAAYRKMVLTVTFFAGIFQAVLDCLVVPSEFRPGLLIPYLPSNCPGRRNKKLFWFPVIAPLISVILSTLIVFLTKADKHGVKIVEQVKGGLNPSSVGEIQLKRPHVGQAAKIGLISAIVALTEAIAVGRSFASIKGYHLDGNKEMLAMGFMNIAGSLTSCYVATGSFSRTAVNFSAGCETVLSNIVMAITVFLSLEFFTRLLYYTPIAILASIILSALPGVLDIHEAYYIWKVDKLDFLACVGAFVGVLFASVEIGLLAAVTISFAKILLNSIRPGIEELGRLPRTDTYCEINQYPMAIRTPGILVVRVNSALLCFANANFVRERILRWVTEEEDHVSNENTKEGIQAVILDMSNVTNVDIAGILALEELHKKLLSHETELAIANPRWQVIHKLKLAKFTDKVGSGRIFFTVAEAVAASISTPNNC